MPDLDLFNAFWKRSEQEADWRGYNSTIKQARPFSLDDDFTSVVAKLMVSKPTDLAKYLRTARLPFPVMWLEADFATAFGGIPTRPRWDDESEFWLTKSAPERVGWLLTQAPNEIIAATRVCRVADPVTGDMGEAMMYPIVYMFSADQRMSVEHRTFRSLEGTVDPEVLRAIRAWNHFPMSMASPWALQISGGAVKGRMTEEELQEACDLFEASPLFETCVGVLEPRTIHRLLNPRVEEIESLYERTSSLLMAGHNDQHGDIAFIVAALAVMNEVPVKYVPFRPSGSIRAGGTMRPYMRSSIVTIEAPATRRRLKDIQRDLRAAAKEHALRARHEVRGHWRHTYKLPKSAGDTHRWEAWVDDKGRPGWRTWIEHHMRGSGGEGFVQQTYEVKRGQGTIPALDRVMEGV